MEAISIRLDAIHYKVNENHQCITKAAYVVLGINLERAERYSRHMRFHSFTTPLTPAVSILTNSYFWTLSQQLNRCSRIPESRVPYFLSK